MGKKGGTVLWNHRHWTIGILCPVKEKVKRKGQKKSKNSVLISVLASAWNCVRHWSFVYKGTDSRQSLLSSAAPWSSPVDLESRWKKNQRTCSHRWEINVGKFFCRRWERRSRVKRERTVTAVVWMGAFGLFDLFSLRRSYLRAVHTELCWTD